MVDNNKQDFVSVQPGDDSQFLGNTESTMMSTPENPVYDVMDTNNVYDVYEDKPNEEDLPDTVASNQSRLLSEVLGRDVTVRTRQELNDYIKVLDDQDSKLTANFIDAVTLDMAENGMNPQEVIAWRSNALTQHPTANGSGVYSLLVDSRLQKLAQEDFVAQANMVSGDKDIQDFTAAMQNFVTNKGMIEDMATKAEARYDEQWITTKMAKGFFGVIPGDQIITSARISSKLKDILELKETKFTKNDLYDAAKFTLTKKAASLTPAEFKDYVNEIDDMLTNGWFTYGERAEFWKQCMDTDYALNAIELPIDAVTTLMGAKGVAKLSSTMAAKGVSKAAIRKATTYAAMNEILPGSGIIGMAAESAIKRPIKKLLLVGQKKAAAELENVLKKGVVDSALESTAVRSKALQDAGQQIMESGLSGVANSTKKLPMSTTGKTAARNMDAIVNAAVKNGLEKATFNDALKLATNIVRGSLGMQLRQSAKADIHRHVVEDILKNIDKKVAIESASTKTANGILETTARIGNGTSNTKGFRTWAEAKVYANKIKLEDNYMGHTANTKVDVVKENGSYWVSVSRKYDDGHGASLSLGDIIKEKLYKQAPEGARKEYSQSGILGMLTTNLSVPHHVRTLNNITQMDEGRAMEALRGLATKIEKGNNPVLETLMRYTKDKESWINPDKLIELGVDKKTIEAYQSLKTLEDTEFLLTGRHILKSLEENGMKNIQVGGARIGIGKTIDTVPPVKNVMFVSGVDDAGNVIATKTHIKELGTDEVTFIKMREAINGNNYIAVNKNILKQTDPSFSNVLMSYKPGRMNFSSNSGFIKQVNKGINEDGEAYMKGISTIFAHYDAESVRKIAPVLEEMRQVAIKYKDANGAMSMTEAQRLFEQIPNREHARYVDFESFYKDCVGEDAIISLEKDSPLVFAKDGDKLVLPKDFDIDDYNFPGASMMQYTNSEKALKKLMRSDAEIFNPFVLTEAPRLNIEEEVSNQLGKIIKYSSINDYTDMMAEDFYSTFRKYVDLSNYTPKDALLNYPIDKVVDRKIGNMMENARNTYERMLSKPTKWDKTIEDFSKGIADWFKPGWHKDLDDSIRANIYKKFNTLSPVRRLRSFAFHWTLGLYNPRQVYVQALASANAAIISPVAAAKITPMLPALEGYLVSGDKSLLTRIAKSFGVKKEWIEDVVEGAKRLDIVSKGSYGGAYDTSQRSKWWERFNSTMFFDWGEHQNRLFTGFLASEEALSKGIKLKDAAPEVVAEWLNRQQNLYINMGRAGSIELQRGVAGAITQFRGYQMRALELLFDKTMTKWERRRFFWLNAAMAGTKGLFGTKLGSSIYNMSIQNLHMSPDVAETIYNGALDEMIKEDGGVYSAGEFFGIHSGELLELAVNPLDWENLPAANTIKKGAGALYGILQGVSMFGRSEVNGDTFDKALTIISTLANENKLPSSLNRGALAAWIWFTGKRLNSKGVLLDSELDHMDAVMAGLGFKRIDDDFAQLVYNASKGFNKTVDEWTEEGVRWQGLMINAPQREREMYAQLFHVYLSSLKDEDPQVQRAVLKGIMSNRNVTNYTVPQVERLIYGYTKQTGYDSFIPALDRELKQAQERRKQ